MNPTRELPEQVGAATQRNGSLGDRVRSLRLSDRGDSGSRPPSTVMPWGISAILLVTALALGYRTYRVGAAAPVPAASSETTAISSPTPAPSVAVAASGEVALEAKGYVIAPHKRQISPKIAGMIVWLDPRFKEGATFHEGEPLARIEDVDYRSNRDKAQATLTTLQEKWRELKNGNRRQEIEQAEADLVECEANLKLYALDLFRSDRLSRSNALALKDYETAKYTHDATAGHAARLRATLSLMREGTREERIKQAEADVAGAKADLERAQWQLDNCELRAPVTGTVLSKNAEKGNIVNPVAFNIAASLCDMADLSDIEIDLSIQERDVANVVPGQQCLILPDAFRNHKPFLKLHPRGYEGQVDRVMPVADRAKGAIPVRVSVKIPKDEAGVYLKPDMGAIVSFQKVADK